MLDEIARGRVPRAWKPIETTTDEEVALLSPLDPVLERQRARDLFDFDYVWEIYKRPEHVLFGRYTMPILFGDRIVGRIDLRTDRKSSTLVVNGVWTEDPKTAGSTEFRAALHAGLRRLLGARGDGARRRDRGRRHPHPPGHNRSPETRVGMMYR